MMRPPSEKAAAWADRIAATLPPFTPAEAAEAGRLAAKIDARRRERQAETRQAA